jgi:tetratricopeptide (TPR) repeat protein
MPSEIERLKKKAYRLRTLGKTREAIEIFERLLRMLPRDRALGMDLADLYLDLEEFDKATSVYARVFELHPKDATAASNLGAALVRQGKINEAKTVLEYCLELDPKNKFALINLGGVHQALGEPLAALNTALSAIALDPTDALAFNNLGSALSDLAQYTEAKHAFETALLLNPEQVDALINVAGCEAKLGDHEASIRHYEEVIASLPETAAYRIQAIKFFAAFQYLQTGDLEKGWEYYEGGFSPLVPVAGSRTPRLTFEQPMWSGEDLNGKTILLWREQGIGDEILFASCIPDLILKFPSAKVIIQCEPRLIEIFRRSFPSARVVGQFAEQIQDLDYHMPFGSLMRRFRSGIHNFQNPIPYFTPESEQKQEMNKRLEPYRNPRTKFVGICWRSGLISATRNSNYTALSDWLEILKDSNDFVFVNLQYGNCEEELRQIEQQCGVRILRWPEVDLKNDMERVFALVSCLDVVVTVGTSVSAIAGSLGVPTIYLVKRGWLFLGQEKFPWFHSFHELVAEGDSPVASKLKEVSPLMRDVLGQF